MIIPGYFIGDAPYFFVRVRLVQFEWEVWLLADTGAARTTLLDRDVGQLGIPATLLEPASLPVVGVGGSVRTLMLRDVELTLASDEGDVGLRQNVWVVQHELDRLPPEEVARMMRLPSVMGWDVINRYNFVCHYQAGLVYLEGESKEMA